jgi:hypothetical protein
MRKVRHRELCPNTKLVNGEAGISGSTINHHANASERENSTDILQENARKWNGKSL